MHSEIFVKHADSIVCRQREAAARAVLSAFGDLPTNRLLCFFDDQDCSALKDESSGFGKANRGVSGPISNPSALRGWPDDAISSIYPSFSLDDNNRAFDFVTYLHDSSCEDPVAMTMTFAHELRHFVQWARMPKVWKANERFRDWLRNFDTGFDSHELPIEKDARIIAKQIAIRIHGREAVDHYVAESIANPVDDLDRRNWRFVYGIDVTKPYDVEIETMLFDDNLKSRPLALRQT
jgi:hypothetical protein